jgi:hypothetical protein
MSKADILLELPRLNREDRREILEQICALDEADLTAAHQAWIDAALRSGPAVPAKAGDWPDALARGLKRAGHES